MEVTYKMIEQANKVLSSVDIKGKDYIPVNQRIKAFRMVYPTGYITTDIISNDNGSVLMKSECGYYSESGVKITLGTGSAFELQSSSYINKTSYIENCESSAVGRALGMAGFGVDASLASFEEVANAQLNQSSSKTAQNSPRTPSKTADTNFICDNCGATFTDARIAKATKEKFNKCICPACIEAKRQESKKA